MAQAIAEQLLGESPDYVALDLWDSNRRIFTKGREPRRQAIRPRSPAG
jgi:hypothetical protein